MTVIPPTQKARPSEGQILGSGPGPEGAGRGRNQGGDDEGRRQRKTQRRARMKAHGVTVSSQAVCI